MSGPIIRKYGFPNFEQIFGERNLNHGVDEETTEESEAPAEPEAAAKPAKKTASKPKTKKS